VLFRSAEREVVGTYKTPDGRDFTKESAGSRGYRTTELSMGRDKGAERRLITAPATELAKKWDGWGTALKPAHEPIIVVRKPLIDADTGRKMTVVDCVEKYGTGAINIDACRIPLKDEKPSTGSGNRNGSGNTYVMKDYVNSNGGNITPEQGRFPANCITLESDAFYSKYFNIS